MCLVPFEILRVQEHRRVAIPGRPEQRQRNEVSDAACREQILRREQPVITSQVHLPANRHRLAQQAGAQSPRSPCRYWRSEEGHACIPTPERDTSSATGTPNARPALTYISASVSASCPSKSAASHQHLSPSSSG